MVQPPLIGMRHTLNVAFLVVLVALLAYSVWVNPDTVSPPTQSGDRPSHIARALQR
jgi:hypothetical protein